MGLVLIAAPTVEPVTVDEAKAHLRIDHPDEDAFLASLIATSRLHIEGALDIALITQSWSWQLTAWPQSGIVEMPLWPVRSVEAVRIGAEAGEVLTLPPNYYALDGTSKPARLCRIQGAWPEPARNSAPGIEIEFKAGFGDNAGDVPMPIRQALLLLVAHWYENREPVVIGGTVARIPETVSALLMPYRRVRL